MLRGERRGPRPGGTGWYKLWYIPHPLSPLTRGRELPSSGVAARDIAHVVRRSEVGRVIRAATETGWLLMVQVEQQWLLGARDVTGCVIDRALAIAADPTRLVSLGAFGLEY